MTDLILFSVGWVISIGLLAAAAYTHRDSQKALRNANKAALYDDLDARIERLRRDEVELLPEIERLKAEKQSAEMDAEAAKRRKMEEERELETTRAEILRIQEQVKQLEPEREELRKTRDALDRTRNELSEGQRKLSDQMAFLGKAQAEMASTTAKLEEATKDLRTCEQRLPSLRAEMATLESRERELRGGVSQLQQELEALRGAKEAAENRVQELSGRHRELESRIAQAASQLRALEDECKKRELELREAKQQLASTQQSLASSRSEAETLQRTLDGLSRQVAEIQDQRDVAERAAKAQIAELERRREAIAKEVGGLERKAEGIKDEVDKLRQEADLTRSKIREQEGILRGLEGQQGKLEQLVQVLSESAKHLGLHTSQTPMQALEDIRQPLNLSFESRPTGNGHESEAGYLDALAKRMSKAGLHFHPRVLAAFHTSLKTSDFNQLTVLAGVSGTGKSALPRAYAAAMGIHCLVVPVQPGWAGPQDLLGFFNYLERKYKATDLARYLARFSKYALEDLSMPDFKEAASRKDELLLVLLDEMNLARVEYYFSEFLSRLEMRESIKPDERDQRLRISIQLDTGPLKDSVRRPSLYPDTNILFVGTMNEDESTQTLSEKVVDRANVLRFGSPHIDSLKSRSGNRNVVEPIDRALSRSVWEGWCRSDRNGVNREQRLKVLETSLKQLGEAMDKLRRPFGHRVHEAMIRYTLAYPVQAGIDDRRAGALALADQIEQKILPKLRGVDTNENEAAFGILQTVVGSLGDDPLLQELQRCVERPSFEWLGLKREEKQG